MARVNELFSELADVMDDLRDALGVRAATTSTDAPVETAPETAPRFDRPVVDVAPTEEAVTRFKQGGYVALRNTFSAQITKITAERGDWVMEGTDGRETFRWNKDGISLDGNRQHDIV